MAHKGNTFHNPAGNTLITNHFSAYRTLNTGVAVTGTL
jgi:hypothetical protein